MPPTGVEPVLCLQKGILSPSCLPISPQRRKPGLQSPAALWLEREPGITGVRKKLLQPHCYSQSGGTIILIKISGFYDTIVSLFCQEKPLIWCCFEK